MSLEKEGGGKTVPVIKTKEGQGWKSWTSVKTCNGGTSRKKEFTITGGGRHQQGVKKVSIERRKKRN